MQERPPLQRVLVWAVAAALIGFGSFRLLEPRDGDGARRVPAVKVQGGGAGTGTSERVYVHVAGAVRRPGVYRLREGARAGDAVRRAGGVLPRGDPAAVNLAAPLEDGQQVIVPRRGAAAEGLGEGGPAGAGGKVSLATATVEQLDGLEGIGPTLAQRIVDYRDEHGGFRSVDELREVEGIGDKRFAALRDAVRP